MTCIVCGREVFGGNQTKYCNPCRQIATREKKRITNARYRENLVAAKGIAHAGNQITPVPVETIEKVRRWREEQALAQECRQTLHEARRQEEVRRVVKNPCDVCGLRHLPTELYSGKCESCWEEARERDIDALRGRERRLVGASTCPRCSSKLLSDGTCFRCRETALTEGRRDSL